MNIRYKIASLVLVLLAITLSVVLYNYGVHSAVLDPKGIIGLKEKHLISVAMFLMLLVVIPVFVLTFFICWRYREGNKDAKYTPDWEDSALAEAVWWGFPLIIIVILSVITWNSSYDLDPYKPISSEVKPIKIQVVALQWKWLFIFPEQKIATINYFEFPEKTPLNFEITANAPMNSFWIPQLGGQIYAMPRMNTKLHLIADQIGEYRGSSANLSGEGFAGMTFIAKAVSENDFNDWVEKVKRGDLTLDYAKYLELAKPTQYAPKAAYRLTDEQLYDQILMPQTGEVK